MGSINILPLHSFSAAKLDYVVRKLYQCYGSLVAAILIKETNGAKSGHFSPSSSGTTYLESWGMLSAFPAGSSQSLLATRPSLTSVNAYDNVN